MSEGPKLYNYNPRKKQNKRHHKPAMETHSTAPPPPPPPPPPKEPFVRRYKYLWPMLLAVNLAIGAYVFLRTKKKDTIVEEQEASPVSTKDAATPHIAETTVTSQPITTPVFKREPIPEDQQRELFKWLLEEKRKIKPKDAEEKQRIDEEKALLKKFIRSKSIPSIY